MTFELGIWSAGLSLLCLCQDQRSNSRSRDGKCSIFGHVRTHRKFVYILNRETETPNSRTTLSKLKTPNYWLVVCRVCCLKVVGEAF